MSDAVALRPDIIHAHAAVPEPLHDRSAEGVVVGLERASVPLALLERCALVRLRRAVYRTMSVIITATSRRSSGSLTAAPPRSTAREAWCAFARP